MAVSGRAGPRRTSVADHVAPAVLRARPLLVRIAAFRVKRTALSGVGLSCFAVSASHFGWWVGVGVAGVACMVAEWVYDPVSGPHARE